MTARGVRIPVRFEVGRALAGRVDTASLEAALRRALRDELGRLGLPGTVAVEVGKRDGPRMFGLRVHGRPLGYPPRLLIRLWQAVTPRDEQVVGAERATYSEAWLADTLRGDSPETSLEDLAVELALALVRRTPAVLLDDRVVGAYLGRAGVRRGTRAFDAVRWPSVLQTLMRLRGTLADPKAVAGAVLAAVGSGLDEDDAVESAFAALRDGGVEIHGNADQLTVLFGHPVDSALLLRDLGPSWAERHEALEGGWFLQTGLPLPDISVVPSAAADPGRLEVRVGGRPGLPFRMIGPGELLARAGVDRLAKEGLDARAEIDPLNGMGAACVSVAARDRLEKAEVPFLDSETLIVELVAQELRRNRKRLLTIEDLENQLATLKVGFPAVAGAALTTFPLGTLARTARLLVDEDLPVQDLRTFLSRLLESEYELGIEPHATNGASPEARTNGSSAAPAGAEAHADFVRAGLQDLFASRHGLNGECSVIRVDPALERRLAESPELSEPEAERVRDQLRSLVGSVEDEVRPVVLTTRAARRPVRSVLRTEVPAVPVLSYDELPLRVRRVTLATIGSRKPR